MISFSMGVLLLSNSESQVSLLVWCPASYTPNAAALLPSVSFLLTSTVLHAPEEWSQLVYLWNPLLGFSINVSLTLELPPILTSLSSFPWLLGLTGVCSIAWPGPPPSKSLSFRASFCPHDRLRDRGFLGQSAGMICSFFALVPSVHKYSLLGS